MEKIEYTGNVNEFGKLHVVHEKQFKEDLKRFSGKKVIILIKRLRKSRTHPQLKYYFGVVLEMIQEALKELGNDYSKEQLHEYFKLEYWYLEFVEPSTGEVKRIAKEMKWSGSNTMSTSDMINYLDMVKMWASENLNLYIPDPEEQTNINFREGWE